MSGFLTLLSLNELHLKGGTFFQQNSSWIQVLDSLKIENYFYQNTKDCALILECLGFYLFGFSLMINFCSRFPNLSKSVLSGNSEQAFISSLKDATSHEMMVHSIDTIQSGKHLPWSLKPHTFSGSCSKSPFKRLLFQTNKGNCPFQQFEAGQGQDFSLS